MLSDGEGVIIAREEGDGGGLMGMDGWMGDGRWDG